MSIERVLCQPRAGAACGLCGMHLGLYIVRGEHHSLCAPCTKARVDACPAQQSERPAWVAILYDEVVHEIRHREYQEQRGYTVSWDLVKCSACGRMMKRSEAKYRVPGVDRSEESPKSIIAPARQFADGTLLIFPPDRVPEIHHAVCFPCYEVSD